MVSFCLSALADPEGLRSFFHLRCPTFDWRDFSFLLCDDGLLLFLLLPLCDMSRILPLSNSAEIADKARLANRLRTVNWLLYLMAACKLLHLCLNRYKKEKVLGALIVPPKPVYIIISSHKCQPDSSFL